MKYEHKQLLNRNYKAVVNRGCITPATTLLDFLEKTEEEFYEVMNAHNIGDTEPNTHTIEELGDLINVCNNLLIHYGHNPDDILKAIARKNENRVT